MSYRAIAGLLAALAVVALSAAAVACSRNDDGKDPESFADFAGDIAGAAEDGDVQFFIDRLQGDLYTCTEDDARYTPGPGGPELDLCLNAGEQFDGVFIAPYPGISLLTTEERLGEDITTFFELATEDQEDQYGPGGPRLYATATAEETETPQQVSLLTGLIESELVATDYGRATRALYWEYQDGRWVIVGLVGAVPPLAVDLLEPSLVPAFLTNWQRFGDEDGEPAAQPTAQTTADSISG